MLPQRDGLRHKRLPRLEPLEDRTLLTSGSTLDSPAITAAPTATDTVPLAVPLGGGTPSPVGLNPTQIAQAYGFNAIYFQGNIQGDGTGQTIAVIDPYSDAAFVPSGSPGFNASDLAQFDKQFDLPDPTFTIATPDGIPQQAPAPNSQGSSWGLETALDVEWAHALAPGAAILLVETPGGTTTEIDLGLIDGVNFARTQPGVSVVSMSWTESSSISDTTFTTRSSHQGITFVAGSGDDGSPASYPASSPNVLAVGGTYFPAGLDQEGDYSVESAWNGSGGGVDTSEPQLPAQAQAIGAGGGRSLPDVAFDAGNAVAVLDSYDYGTSPWVPVTGTSIGAPAWSALVAIADQGRVIKGETTLDGATQTIPDLYAIYESSNYTAAFDDITTGGNNLNQATTGYDQVTGLGSPKAAAIALSLSGDVDAPQLIAPEANAIVPDTTPTFQWAPVVNAARYELTVLDMTDDTQVISFTTPSSPDGTASTSYTPTTPLTGGDTYSWNVTALSAGGYASANPAQAPSFVIVPVPVPTGPSGVVDSTLPSLQWSAVAGASGYQVTLDDVTADTIVVNALAVSTTSYTPTSPLNNLDTYDWAVSAVNNNGTGGSSYVSPASGLVYFTVDLDEPPVLLSPQNGASLITATPTLTWSPVTGAVSYAVSIINLDTETSATYSVTTPAFTPSTSLTSESYEWSVQAFVLYDGNVIPGATSESSYFDVFGEATSTLVRPQPGQVVTTLYPTFQWSLNGNTGVSLSLFDVTDDSTVVSGFSVNASSLTLGFALENGHSYYWSLGPIFGRGDEFTVDVPGGGDESLSAPTPIGPTGIITSAQPTFQWTAVTGATYYELTVGEGEEVFAPIVVTGTSYTLPPPTVNLPSIYTESSYSYRWTVAAFNSAGDYSPPSSSQDFFFQSSTQPALSAPQNLSPGGSVNEPSPTFSWSAVPGASAYRLSLTDDTLGDSVLPSVQIAATFASIGPGSTFNLPPLVDGHLYRWYVYAINTSGSTTESGPVSTQSFTVSDPPTGAPLQTTPGVDGTVTSTSPLFTWSAVAGATSYSFFYNVSILGFHIGSDPGITVAGNSFSPNPPLLNGMLYQWEVAAVFTVDGVSEYGPASLPSQFVVSVPGTPDLAAQGDTGTLATATPTLEWSAVPGASGYDVYLEDTTTGNLVLDDLAVISTAYTVETPLDNGDSYAWYVTAYDNYNDVGAAPVPLNFSVSVPTVAAVTPNPPEPIGKLKGVIPVLQWSPVASAVGYDLYVNDTSTGKPIPGSPFSVAASNGQGELSYPLSSPLPVSDGYAYYVRAVFADGSTGPSGNTESFTLTTASDLAGPPALVGPVGTTSSTVPAFSWSPVTNAAGYDIEIEDTTANTIQYVLYPSQVSGTSYSPGEPLIPGHTYQWLVAAYDGSGEETAWSAASVHVLLPKPTPISPAGVTNSTVPTFQWSTVAGAAGYEIEVIQYSGGTFTTVVGPTSVGSTSYSTSEPFVAGQSYQWQVAAIDSSGMVGTWSSPVAFTLPPPPPPPWATHATPVTKKHKLTAISVIFDEALQTSSANLTGFYQVTRQVAIKRKKPVYGPPISFRVSFDGNRDVTLTLKKPIIGPVRVMVLPGIVSADGLASSQPFNFIIK